MKTPFSVKQVHDEFQENAQHQISIIISLSLIILVCLLCLLAYSAESVATTVDVDRLMGYDEELRRRSAALLLLKLKERRRVSQVAIDDIIEHSKVQFDRTVSIVLAETRSHLAERGINPDELDLDSALSKLNHPFSALDTKHKQDKYFRDKLGLIVS